MMKKTNTKSKTTKFAMKNKLTSSYPAKLATESPQFCELIVLPFKISSVAILLQVQFS
jgi:hypothetical protein